MIGKEDFVTFEVAKMLHEKGYSGMITCLRNKKTYISVLPTRDNGVTVWYYQVVNDNDPDDIYYTTSQDTYPNYETALNEGIKYALNLSYESIQNKTHSKWSLL